MRHLSSLALLLLCFAGRPVVAYDFIGSTPLKWDAGNIPMDLQLNATLPPQTLRDGRSSWNAIAQSALSIWNTRLQPVRFTTFTDNTRGDGNRKNEVFFSPTVYGHAFGRDVLAVTTTWRIGSERVEADTIFNTAIDWDSYRGNLDPNAMDLRRVAIHEFGHTLGLDHPDQAGQVHVAIMNSTISDLDTLAADDIRGVRALYPPAARYALDLGAFPEAGGLIVATPPPGADGKYQAGQLVTLSARPSRGHRFNGWNGPAAGTRRNLQVRVVENEIIRADFSTNRAPVITLQPRSKFACYAETVSFRVAARNAAGASYQWQFNERDLPGATKPSLVLYLVQHADSGTYSCRITTPRGSTSSQSARLVVDGY